MKHTIVFKDNTKYFADDRRGLGRPRRSDYTKRPKYYSDLIAECKEEVRREREAKKVIKIKKDNSINWLVAGIVFVFILTLL